MATTAGYTFPMRPAGGSGGTAALESTVVPMDPSVAFSEGDIIVVDSGTKDAQVNNNGTEGTNFVLGIAMVGASGVTAAATIDRDANPGPDVSGNYHAMNVCLALPGQRFSGNIIAGASDETGVYADNIRTAFGTIESADGYACIDQSDTTNVYVFTMEYENPQIDVSGAVTGSASPRNYVKGRESGVGILNPRMRFYFLVNSTVFGTAA